LGDRTTVQNKIVDHSETPVIPAHAGIYKQTDLDSRMRGNDRFVQ
jgi:hypothetical protein